MPRNLVIRTLLYFAIALGIPVEVSIGGETVIPGPFVEGETWTLTGSPYRVTGDLNMSEMTIEPGVQVLIDSPNGSPITIDFVTPIHAVGTPSQKIEFRAFDPKVPWSGIRIEFNDDVQLVHCVISDASDAALNILNSSPEIRHCELSGNSSSTNGGGIDARLGAGDLVLEDCVIAHNDSRFHGGGIHAEMLTGALVLRRCAIDSNRANPTNGISSLIRGGGVWIEGDASFIDCSFTRNEVRTNVNGIAAAVSQGGGVFVESGDVELVNSFIGNNVLYASGGFNGDNRGNGAGVFVNEQGLFRSINSVIGANVANGSGSRRQGGGVFTYVGQSEFYGSTIARNFPDGLRNLDGTQKVRNSIVFWNNNLGDHQYGAQIVGDASVGFSNVQGGAPGIGNVSVNPGFIGSGNELDDFLIAMASPCVDAGSIDFVQADSYDVDDDGITGEHIALDVAGNARLRGPAVDIGAAEAQVGDVIRVWNNPAQGAFSDPAHWSPNAPSAESTIVFEPAGSTEAELGGPDGAGRVFVSRGDVTLDLQGNSLALSGAPDAAMAIGRWADESASLTLTPGTLNAALSIVGPRGVLAGETDIVGDVLSAGRVRPGMGVSGQMVIDGDYSQMYGDEVTPTQSGTIDVTISSPDSRGESAPLVVTGHAELSGSLLVRREGELSLSLGDEIDILTCGSLSGVFETAFLPGLPDGLFLTVRYDEGGGARGIPRVYLKVEQLGQTSGYEDTEDYVVQGVPIATATGDLNGDGLDDVVAALSGGPGAVAILLNDGVDMGGAWLGFQDPTVQIAVGNALTELSDVILANWDRDVAVPGESVIDIAAVDRVRHRIYFLLNNGLGSFPTMNDEPIGLEDIRRGAATDLNADGDADLVITGLTAPGTLGMGLDPGGIGVVAYLFNQSSPGSVSFGPESFVLTTEDPCDVDPGDFDNDKDTDLAVAGFASVLLIENTGSNAAPSFNPMMEIPIGDGPLDVGVADFNGDSRLDMIAAARTEGTLSVVRNASTTGIHFAAPFAIGVGDDPRSVAIADADQDGPGGFGDEDVALVVSGVTDGDVRILRNDSDANAIVLSDVGIVPESIDVLFVEAADVDGDGVNDLVTVSQALAAARSGRATETDVSVLRGVVTPTMNDCPADFDADGSVGASDLAALLSCWTTQARLAQGDVCLEADLAPDGLIGAQDLAELLSVWGPCP